MKENFLTIRDARALTGKSEITIRRLIKDLLSSEDTQTKNNVKKEYQNDNPLSPHYRYRVSKDYLVNYFKLDISKTSDDDVQDKANDMLKTISNSANDKVLELLEKTTEVLSAQLKAKDKQIDALNERLRENQFMLNNANADVRRLAIDAPREKAEVVNVMTPEQPTTIINDEPVSAEEKQID